jgi:hypothetical protein
MRLDILFLLSFLFIIVGLIACSPPLNPTPTLPPTLLPLVTLTTYNPQFITTLSPRPLPSTTIVPPTLQLSEIKVSPPLCYRLDSQQITCLGYVMNESDKRVGDITLKAVFIGTNDDIRKEENFTLEQRNIDAGEVAPYRIQVPMPHMDDAYLQIQLVSANLSSTPPLSLRLLNMQGSYHLDDNRYVFTAELENPTAFIATQTRLIVTLENELGNIIGYRVATRPDSLSSGERIPIVLMITPLEATATIRHRITLEAFPSDISPTPEG